MSRRSATSCPAFFMIAACCLVVMLSGCGHTGGGGVSPSPSDSPSQTGLTAEEQDYIDHAFAIGKEESAAWKVILVGANGDGAKLQKTLMKVLDLQSEWSNVSPPTDRLTLVGEYTTRATEVLNDGVMEFVKAIKTRDPVHGHAATRKHMEGMRLLLRASKEALKLSQKYGFQ